MATRISTASVKMRKSPKQARSRETVDAIVEAATRILCQRGWSRFTTNEVAEVAGVSVGSLYQYFPNKAALVAAVRRRHNEQVLSAMTAVCGSEGASSIGERAKRLVRGIVVTHEIDPKLHAVLDQVPHDPSSPAGDESYGALMQCLIALVSDRVDEEDAASAAVAAHVLWGAMEGVMHFGSRLGQLTEPAFEDELLTLVEAYLLRRTQSETSRERSRRRSLAFQ